eukprot:356968-Chlamydomonas_euryale.AAC.40
MPMSTRRRASGLGGLGPGAGARSVGSGADSEATVSVAGRHAAIGGKRVAEQADADVDGSDAPDSNKRPVRACRRGKQRREYDATARPSPPPPMPPTPAAPASRREGLRRRLAVGGSASVTLAAQRGVPKKRRQVQQYADPMEYYPRAWLTGQRPGATVGETSSHSATLQSACSPAFWCKAAEGIRSNLRLLLQTCGRPSHETDQGSCLGVLVLRGRRTRRAPAGTPSVRVLVPLEESTNTQTRQGRVQVAPRRLRDHQ